MDFKPSSAFSLGVEIEFQILDGENYALVPFGPMLLEQAPQMLRPRLSLEFIKSILEIQTGICADLRDVENDLLQTCALAEELAAEHNFLLYAASLHPFARAAGQQLSDDDRYERIMQELQIIGKRFISQGLHVHVGLPDSQTVIAVCNHVQAFLPIFLSLSTSSPFFQSKDTGLMSYRTKLFEVLPLAGIYNHIRDWDHFVYEINDLKEHGIIGSFRDLWWDARPNPEFGTLEIRICDLPTKFTDILALVALIQASVSWLAEQSATQTQRFLRPHLLQANKWQAARYGLDGRFIDPTGLLSNQAMNFRLAAMLLKKKVVPFAVRLGSSNFIEQLDPIISRGTGADLMRRIYQQSSDFRKVIGDVHQGFWK